MILYTEYAVKVLVFQCNSGSNNLSKIINGLLKLLRHLHLQDNGTVENGNGQNWVFIYLF